MSIGSQNISFVGKIFDNEEKLLNYLVSKNIIIQNVADDYLNWIHDGEGNLEDIIDVSHVQNFPRLEMVDYVLGGNLFLGYVMVTDVRQGTSPDKLQQDIVKAQESWKNIFNDTVELEDVTQYR